MALKVKGGVLFDDSSGQDVVFEGAFPSSSVVTEGAVLAALGVSALGAAGAAVLELDTFGTSGQVLATNATVDGVEWVAPV